VLENGTAIYGGFAGTETLLTERNPTTNLTTLSGDLLGNDSGFTNNGENSYHIVTGSGLTNTAVLDGFTIRGGNADNGFTDYNGGGVQLSNSSPTLGNLIITSNYASLFGGGMYTNNGSPDLTEVTFSVNSVYYFGNGGGMYNDGSSPTLTNVTFNGNFIGDDVDSNNGAGMYNTNSNVTITNAIFSNNTALTSQGGGIYNINSTLSITNATFSSNSALAGGGISNNSGTTTLTNVTFSGNSGSFYGGGIENNSGNTLTLVNVTFSGNSGANGGGLVNRGSVSLKNTILANNPGGDCVLVGSGSIAAASNNLIKNTGANACGLVNGSNDNIIGSDPDLGSITGSPAYFPLNTNSLAIDAGTNTGCPSTSQNGVARPQGGTCDIGSYEMDVPPTVTFDSNGGTGSMSDQTASSPTALSTNTFTRTGYSFSGWNTAVNGSGISYANGAIYDFSADITLYAQWTIATTTLIVKSAPANDGWILESAEASNAGGSLNSAATTLVLGDDGSDREYRAILHFDTSALPDTAVVTNMTLKVKQQGSVMGADPFSFASLYVDMRKPSFGNALLQSTDFNFAANKVKSAVFNPNAVSGWFSARFNTGGKLYVNRTGVTQLRLYFSTGDNNNSITDFIRFYSGNASAGDRPKLLITYYVP
jgi:uncharacterized repeat protein (TIGR02543 family)